MQSVAKQCIVICNKLDIFDINNLLKMQYYIYHILKFINLTEEQMMICGLNFIELCYWKITCSYADIQLVEYR